VPDLPAHQFHASIFFQRQPSLIQQLAYVASLLHDLLLAQFALQQFLLIFVLPDVRRLLLLQQFVRHDDWLFQ
jgi:hypothetical protein